MNNADFKGVVRLRQGGACGFCRFSEGKWRRRAGTLPPALILPPRLASPEAGEVSPPHAQQANSTPQALHLPQEFLPNPPEAFSTYSPSLQPLSYPKDRRPYHSTTVLGYHWPSLICNIFCVHACFYGGREKGKTRERS